MKIKNKSLIISLALAGIVFSNCKKNYTCSCTNNTVETSSFGVTETKGESATSYTKVTKKYAHENCTSGKDIATTGTGTNAVTVDRVWNCSLNGAGR